MRSRECPLGTTPRGRFAGRHLAPVSEERTARTGRASQAGQSPNGRERKEPYHG